MLKKIYYILLLVVNIVFNFMFDKLRLYVIIVKSLLVDIIIMYILFFYDIL